MSEINELDLDFASEQIQADAKDVGQILSELLHGD